MGNVFRSSSPETNQAGAIGSARPSLAAELFEWIAEGIIEGQYPVGARISDTAIAAQYGVSRMPVREALKRLERLGMVEMRPNRYTRVTEVSEVATRHSAEFVGYQSGIAARSAIAHMRESERKMAARYAEAVAEALSNGQDSALYRLVLLRYLVRHCGNTMQMRLMSEAQVLLRRNLRQWSPGSGDGTALAESYRRLARAIREGKADEGERLARVIYGVGEDPGGGGAADTP